MKLRNLIILALTVFVIASCGQKKATSLDQKKSELANITKQINDLNAKRKVLEDEIAALDPNKKNKGKEVEIETIAAGEFKSYLEVQGRADAEQSTIATAKVPSTVTAVLVREGQFVSAGQALAYLDNNAIKQNRGPLEQQLSLLTTVFEKQKRLWEQGVGTEIQYLQAKTQKEAMEKQLYALDAQINMYIVTAPISGSIESVDVKVGQAAAPGVPMFKVVNLSGLKAVSDVAETNSKKINQGDVVSVFFPDIDKKIETKISFASRLIDPLNRTFKVEARLGAVADVKPNMICKMRIVDYANSKALTIPTNAIQNTEEGSFIIMAVEKEGKTVAQRKQIKTGKSSEGRTEILEGLSIGDRVIVNGFEELNDDQVIQLENK